MTIEDFFNKNNCYKVTSEGSINTRCPFCGDSQKPHHLVNYGQAYLFPDGYFKCFRCGHYDTAQNAVIKIAQSLKINPPTEILNHFKIKSKRYIALNTDVKFNHIEQTEEDIKKYPMKIKYLKSRLKLDTIDLDFINKNKIIINIEPYHEQINKRFKRFNYDSYIGFLTFNNLKLVLRSIDNQSKYRYININANNNSFDFWSKDSLYSDLIRSNDRTYILSEGIFTGLDCHVKEYFSNSNIVASLSKNNLINTIKKIFFDTILRFNVICLVDRDVSMSYIRFMKKIVTNNKYVSAISFYKNLLDNDFNSDKIQFYKLKV